MLDVQIETGTTRVFATAIDWPGWARSAKDEPGAIDALVAYGPRYKAAVKKRLALPTSASDVRVVARVAGDSNTDFGVPASPEGDADAVDARQLKRLVDVVEASWAAFDRAAAAAKGKALTKGPRGGGRSVAKIVEHQREAERAYLAKLGGRAPATAGTDELRAAFLDALEARNRATSPTGGPVAGPAGRQPRPCAVPPGMRSTTRGRSRTGRNTRSNHMRVSRHTPSVRWAPCRPSTSWPSGSRRC